MLSPGLLRLARKVENRQKRLPRYSEIIAANQNWQQAQKCTPLRAASIRATDFDGARNCQRLLNQILKLTPSLACAALTAGKLSYGIKPLPSHPETSLAEIMSDKGNSPVGLFRRPIRILVKQLLVKPRHAQMYR